MNRLPNNHRARQPDDKDVEWAATFYHRVSDPRRRFMAMILRRWRAVGTVTPAPRPRRASRRIRVRARRSPAARRAGTGGGSSDGNGDGGGDPPRRLTAPPLLPGLGGAL